MATLVLGPTPPELSELIERRRALGQDLYDEVWEGDYHMAPFPNRWHGHTVVRIIELLAASATAAGLNATDGFNLGAPNDFRVPDLGYHRDFSAEAFTATAAIVVEVVLPHDESYDKFSFYAAHGVDEVLIVDPGLRAARWFVLADGYQEREQSILLGVSGVDIAAGLRWPDEPSN